jgi:hypothetical protein
MCFIIIALVIIATRNVLVSRAQNLAYKIIHKDIEYYNSEFSITKEKENLIIYNRILAKIIQIENDYWKLVFNFKLWSFDKFYPNLKEYSENAGKNLDSETR